jgi:hypothetical protein
MSRTVLISLVCAIVAAVIPSVPARAQSEAGTVAAVQGTFEVQHAGTWQTARSGLPVFVGDQIRTGADGRGKVVFQDDSVLAVAPNTEIRLDAQVFDPGARKFQSLLHLAGGKIRAWVSDYYHEPRGRYEVETPTAVAGVRGTEFVVVYDATTETTDVVGITDRVDVTGKLAVMGAPVQVAPHFYTRVQKGRFPTAPQRLDDLRLRQYLEGLELIGTGRRDGLNVLHPAVVGRVLAPSDVPRAAGAAAAPAAAAELGAGAPQEPLADRLSPDVRTNTQPLLDYQNVPPGQAPPGSVKVGF